MINRPCHVESADKRTSIKDLTHPKIKYRFGGALEQNQIMLLHTCSSFPENTFALLENVYLGGDMQTLNKILHEECENEVYLCFGYTGWGAGMLEQEIQEGLWLKQPAERDLIFKTQSDKLWSKLVYQMGGKYKMLSQMPQDLSQN
jgi:putative transcriptional regulator